nr:RNA-directed DNA polymerase, eukaryota [Tanacetum cinerariifolium]
SKEDHVHRISKSVFVTNFSDNFGSRDLWDICEAYGKVVDVFILNRKSKAGKRFAFVRFIRVVDMDRLIGNLCTLWVGRFHLHANVVRYERPIKSSTSKKVTAEKPPSSFNHQPSGSYVNAVNDTNSPLIFNHPGSGSPALVLDDSCVNNRVFLEVQLSYLGGLWVMMEVKSEKIKRKMLQHTGVNSWFHDLLAATHDLVINERIVWVDIEGLPLNLWSSASFSKIGQKTLHLDALLLEFKESGYNSKDNSFLGNVNNLDTLQHDKANSTGESDDEGVSDTIFCDNSQSPCHDRHDENVQETIQHSEDPFGLYKLLKKPINNPIVEDATSLSHPPSLPLRCCNRKLKMLTQIINRRSNPNHTLRNGLLQKLKGETIVLGDFNEVRCEEERFDSIFHQSYARDFNQFISSSGLMEVKMEGRFEQPISARLKLNMPFPNRLSLDQVGDLEKDISHEEIGNVVWDCGVRCFPRGGNSSFIALIPKVTNAKFVADFHPISLIGNVYKVVTKILANRLAMVILYLISNTQSAFVASRQILDGPFILNEVLSWCKRKMKQALVFKVDFAKAYVSVHWDFLLDVLLAFGFGLKWCHWIRGIFSSNMASVLVNGSPTTEFSIYRGLKQGYPLSPFLFILIMKSLHLFVSREVIDGIFKGLHIRGSTSISHLFYADDAVFIGLSINVNKSHVLGVGVPLDIVQQGAACIGYGIMNTPFKYLGVMIRIGDGSNTRFWLDTWILDSPLYVRFPWLFALESVKDISVAIKWGAPSLDASFRRRARDGVKSNQWSEFFSMLDSVTLSSSPDRIFCNLNATRWVKTVPIKIDILAWHTRLDRLPNRVNLITRGINIDSSLCPVCSSVPEDSNHLFFLCDLGK